MKIRAMAAVGYLCALAAVISGCSSFAGPPGGAVGNRINDQLRPYEASGTALVDFDATIDGDWDRMLIVCWGATQDELTSALGFDWIPEPSLSAPGFDSVAIFATDDRVISSFSTGQDDAWVNVKYFGLCPLTVETEPFPELVEVERSQSQVRFELLRRPEEPTLDTWYVSGKTLRELAEAGKDR